MARPKRVRAAAFLCSAHTPAQFPPPTLPEVAFAGRSNVGKSTLLNALAGRRALAKVSRTPGKTQAINFFLVNDELRWVDFPGYGYAKVSKKMQAHWGRLVTQYLDGREDLRGVMCLSDSRRAPTELDVKLVQWLNTLDVPWVGVLTKADKLKQAERVRAERRAREVYGCGPDQPLVLCSATTGRGLDALWPYLLLSDELADRPD